MPNSQLPLQGIKPNHYYLEFENALKAKFFELRPTLVAKGTEPLEELILQEAFKKLFIIDRTMIKQEAFEAGYLLWEACNRSVEKFLSLFEVKIVDGHLLLEAIDIEVKNALTGEDEKQEDSATGK